MAKFKTTCPDRWRYDLYLDNEWGIRFVKASTLKVITKMVKMHRPTIGRWLLKNGCDRKGPFVMEWDPIGEDWEYLRPDAET
jgi:hypothetical protein